MAYCQLTTLCHKIFHPCCMVSCSPISSLMPVWPPGPCFRGYAGDHSRHCIWGRNAVFWGWPDPCDTRWGTALQHNCNCANCCSSRARSEKRQKQNSQQAHKQTKQTKYICHALNYSTLSISLYSRGLLVRQDRKSFALYHCLQTLCRGDCSTVPHRGGQCQWCLWRRDTHWPRLCHEWNPSGRGGSKWHLAATQIPLESFK